MFFFHFFKVLNSQVPYIMIVIYGAHVWNNNIFRCFFHFFKIVIFWVVRGVKGQKKVQKDKKFCPLCSILQEPYIMIVIYGAHVWNNIFRCFFHFFKILIFWVVRGVKGQKEVQNDKKSCPSHSISQEPYIIWPLFMVHICKMIISSNVFFIFSKFWFSGSFGA